MRRLAIALAALVALGAAVGGGVAVGMALDDEEPQAITDAQHDRLVDGCVTETENAPECVAWVGDAVEHAEAEGIGYTELANDMAEAFVQQEQDAAEAEQRRQEGLQRELCDWLDPREGQEPMCDTLDAESAP